MSFYPTPVFLSKHLWKVMEILLHKPDANGTPKNYIYKVI